MSATMYDGSEEPSAWGQLPPKIADALKDLDLQPTPAAIRLLRSASQLGEHKDSDHDVLSASGLLFTVVELARQRSERVTELNDSENEALQIVGRFFWANSISAQKCLILWLCQTSTARALNLGIGRIPDRDPPWTSLTQ